MSAAPSDPTQRTSDPPPGAAGPAGTGAPRAHRPRLVSDGARYVVSFTATAALGAAYGSLASTVRPDDVGTLGFIVTVYFGAWSVYSLLYAGLTWAVLHRADGITLRAWLAEDRTGRRRRRRTEWLTGNAGPLGAVTFCAVAIGAVVWAAVLPELRGDAVVVGLAVLVVAASWLLIVTVYAVHYARENVRLDGLRFHDTDHGPPRLTDYGYVAVQVGTAYSSADVTVTSRAMRRTVTLHAVVAFVFNSVLVSLLVSLLITVTT